MLPQDTPQSCSLPPRDPFVTARCPASLVPSPAPLPPSPVPVVPVGHPGTGACGLERACGLGEMVNAPYSFWSLCHPGHDAWPFIIIDKNSLLTFHFIFPSPFTPLYPLPLPHFMQPPHCPPRPSSFFFPPLYPPRYQPSRAVCLLSVCVCFAKSVCSLDSTNEGDHMVLVL